MGQRLLKLAVAGPVLVGCLVAMPLATSAATPRLASCALSGSGHIQICPVAFKAVAGKSANVVVARYADFSGCNLAAPSNEPGENQNYVVASVTINWGDHTHATSGVAHTGKGCEPSDGLDTAPGLNEPVTGVHRYKKAGSYRVSVSLTYVRGTGNTFQNCATATRGDTVYNNLTNCIALNAPVASIATVKKG